MKKNQVVIDSLNSLLVLSLGHGDEFMEKLARDGLEIVKQKMVEYDAMLDFIRQFFSNFEDCDKCEGSGLWMGDTCPACHGIGKQIKSHGIIMAELLPEAERILNEQS